MAENKGQAVTSPEIYVSPEMIAAGALVIDDAIFDRPCPPASDSLAERVYIAMSQKAEV